MEQTDNFVAGKVRKILVSRAVTALIVAAIIAGIAVAVGVNFNKLTKPVTHLGVSTSLTNSQFKGGMIVSLTAPDVKDTGIYYTGDSNSSIGAIETKDGYLLVNIPSGKKAIFDQQNVKLTGMVATISSELSQHVDTFASDIAQQSKWTPAEETAFRASFPDLQLNYAGSWQFNVALAWASVVIPVLLALYAISRLVLLGSPQRSNIWRGLVKKGSPVSADELAAKIDEAAANGTLRQVDKALFFTPTAMVAFSGGSGGGSSQLHPLSDLIWVYPLVVRTRIYGAIPAGSNWRVVLCFADKRKVEVMTRNEAKARELDAEILALCPGVLAGYSADRQAKFNLGNMDELRLEASGKVAQSAPTAADTPYEQKQSYYGRAPIMTSKTDKEVRKLTRAAKKAKRGELDAHDVSAPPAGMEATAPPPATAPPEETSFGLGDDEFGTDFK
ncbi:MAG: hypothetical protein FWC54_04725 [Actinomycetia bacterium]|nr:hypothetical protein [Actinomycetes bacterium]